MRKSLGRFTIVLVATAAVLLSVSSASAQQTAPPLSVPAPAPASTPPAGPAASTAGETAEPTTATPAAPATQTKAESESDRAEAPASTAKAERPSKLKLRLKGLRGGKLTVGKKIKLAGTLRPFAQGEKVTAILQRGKKTIQRKTLKVKPKHKGNGGKFRFSKRLIKSGRYSIQVIKNPSKELGGTKNRTRVFKLRYPDLDPGNRSSTVKVFNKLLAKQGYVNDEAKKYDAATGRAVLAFHKVNDKKRTENAKSSDFKKLANGRGGFKLKYPGAGKHVETDLSRQVMVLARKGKAQEIYHISSGTPATPTIQGHFQFYRKEPGTNSLGMVNSVYFIRGYATHGYASVPTYPASHGCLRNPIPDSLHIYNWIDIGDSIYVYR